MSLIKNLKNSNNMASINYEFAEIGGRMPFEIIIDIAIVDGKMKVSLFSKPWYLELTKVRAYSHHLLALESPTKKRCSRSTP